jgi:hypothetical protein
LGINGVIVELYDGATKVGTATTNATGNYYFNKTNVNLGGATGIKPNTAYTLKIAATQFNNTGVASSPLSNLTLATDNAIPAAGITDISDNDATIVSSLATITYTTGSYGQNNHTLDFGFITPPCATITTPSTDQSICNGATGTNITVQTDQNTASSIKYVVFTSDQMAGTTPTATEAAAIYAGTSIATVTPTGASNPYTATYTWNSADFPNATNAAITYYVYAIVEPDGGATCRPVQEIQITVSPLVSAGTATNPAPICQNGSGLTNIDLLSQLAGESTGGTWSQISGTAVGAALSGSILNPNGLASGTYIFRYTVTGIAPCPNDTEDVTVTIQTCCPPKICVGVTAVKN